MIYLKNYERESEFHNLPIMLVVDGLKRLYSNKIFPLIFLRSLGLNTLNKLLPIKVCKLKIFILFNYIIFRI